MARGPDPPPRARSSPPSPADPTSPTGAVGPTAQRAHNRSLVLGELVARGPASRALLAARTGLTKATVSSLVAELLAVEMVAEQGPVRVDRGRPAVPVTVRPGTVAVGVEIDAGTATGAVVDLDGTVTVPPQPLRLPARATPADATATITGLVGQLLDEVPVRRLVGVAVAVPGLVDPDGVHLRVAPNLGWWDAPLGTDLAHCLTEAMGEPVKVTVGNEADLAATAEARAHSAAGLGPADFLYVSAGSGIGAGVVRDGVLFRGAHGFAGELGHFVIRPGGPRCRCGNRGCLETLIGRSAFMRRADPGGRGDPVRRIARAIAATRADPAACGLPDFARDLGIGVAAAVNFLDPAAVVLGGYLGPLTSLLRPHLTEQLGRAVLGNRWSSVTIHAAEVLGPAASLGGAHLLLDTVIARSGA